MNQIEVVDKKQQSQSSNHKHAVQFYKNDTFLVTSVSTYIQSGLYNGEGVIVVAEKEHYDQILTYLSYQNIDTKSLISSGQLVMADSQETLDKFMRNGLPDKDLFNQVICAQIKKMFQSYKVLRAYGEMVNTLWASKNLEGAIALEKLWNDLLKNKTFSLLCGYSFDNFKNDIDGIAFRDVCGCHELIIPDEDRTDTKASPHQLIAELQQKRIALQSEVAERKSIEQALKKNQAKLKKAKESAEAASLAKGHFLANMSHEIRSPLNTILGFTELMKDETLTPAERDAYSKIIDRNGRHLSTVINDILDISKVEAGKLDIEQIPISFPSILADVVGMQRLEAECKGLQLIVNPYPKNVPEKICSDSTRIHQVLTNLIGNAIKFTNKGSVEVTVQAKQESNDIVLEVQIKDTGIGIKSEEQEKIFKPFSQCDASSTRKYGGTGLGLLLSKKLAQLMGGDLELKESKIGKGSTFLVKFKANLSILLENLKDPLLDVPLKPSRELEGIRVLVADDSPDNQLLLQHFLTPEGVIVETASNGLEAVEKALKGDFHIILMDVMMPICDGYDATRRLRRVGFKKPILALTAHALREERDRSLAEGCNDHLTKPVNKRLLISAITKHVFGTN